MTNEMTSHASSWPKPLKLIVSISAKVATLNVLKGRFNQKLSLSDVDPTTERDKGEEAMSIEQIKKELNAEQYRVSKMMKQTADDAARWLQVLTKHLDVDMRNLPDDPPGTGGLNEGMREGLEINDAKEIEIALELILVSLALVVGEAQEIQEKASITRDKKQDSTPPLDYTALSRSLVVMTCQELGLSSTAVIEAEKSLAQHLYFEMQSKENEGTPSKQVNNKWDQATQQYKKDTAKRTNTLKWAATGAGFVLGGVAIGLTGGLAAPAIAPLLAGSLGIAAFSGAGGAVLIGTLLGLGGGGLAGYRTHRRMQGLEDVKFEPIKNDDVPSIPSLTATIVASGFLLEPSDSTVPWLSTFNDNKNDVFSLQADSASFLSAGKSLDNYVRNYVIKMGGIELVKKTALAAAYAAVALPLTIWNTTTLMLDSDFTRCRDKAKKAGALLAEILEKQVQGKRPVVLIGYGPGATIIYHCLLELHNRCLSNLVYSATLISLPESPSRLNWCKIRSVVSHSLVSTWSNNDWVLAVAARLFTLSPNIAGLNCVDVEGITNVDCSDLIQGHLEIRDKLDQILKRVDNQSGVGSKESQVEQTRMGMEKLNT
ncbi:hypothetical protein OIO90_004272 [Microbotryomycetes sp. JL221]|nr:hypothetical protein OIO90_004272 [Microbotryomycetes sp. JL221]